MRFVDEVEVILSSGKGGDGLVSFRRASYIPRGGPDGGNGGRGGAVVLEADRQRNTLVDFRWRRIHRAKDGDPGGGSQMFGRAAEDLVLRVPVGTLVYDADTGELEADLAEPGARYTIPGGRGGRGNEQFKSSTRQTPTFAEPGEPGIERHLRLELKLLADVGLLGFPNAGKSTLISRISSARPKIADYPFTTLTPQLGVVSLAPGESFVVADIPGLIEGAAEGKGLGHQFLKHVERCKLHLHLLAPDQPDADPAQAWQVLQDELARYDEELPERPQIVVLTKIDLLPDEARQRWIAALQKLTGFEVFAVSAVTGEGVDKLKWSVWNRIKHEMPAPDDPEPRID